MRIGSEELAKITDKSKDYWDDYLDKVNYSQILVLVKDKEMHFVLPEPDTESTKEMKKEGEEGIVTVKGELYE